MQHPALCARPAEIVSIVTEEAFDELDAPPERITGAEVSWG
jgi:pyruvate/2-oxoglutarate/acetoin dehydrogenase E1 component